MISKSNMFISVLTLIIFQIYFKRENLILYFKNQVKSILFQKNCINGDYLHTIFFLLGKLFNHTIELRYFGIFFTRIIIWDYIPLDYNHKITSL